MTSRRALQVFLSFLATAAILSGGVVMIFGATIVIGVGEVTPEVDSEMRFFATWYVAAGVMVLRAVAHVERAGVLVRGVALAVFFAGVSRLLSILMVGRPHGFAVTLMLIELTLPFILVPWQASVARSGASEVGDASYGRLREADPVRQGGVGT